MTLQELLDSLWSRYRERVPYARAYEQLAGRLVNDHIAFRTFATDDTGISTIARTFEKHGYRPAGVYAFPDTHLSALHYELAGFPKLFISELRTWELSPRAQEIIRAGGPPRRDDLLALNEESQYAAWVLVHGHAVNHFTALVDDIEKTVADMRAAGIPMKADIEGARGSILRQSSTEAVVEDVAVAGGTLRWPYAYFEIAERPVVDGRRFEGFLAGQAAQLFEMTRWKSSSS